MRDWFVLPMRVDVGSGLPSVAFAVAGGWARRQAGQKVGISVSALYMLCLGNGEDALDGRPVFDACTAIAITLAA